MFETIEVGIGAAVWAEADPDLGEDVDLVGSSALRARKAATALPDVVEPFGACRRTSESSIWRRPHVPVRCPARSRRAARLQAAAAASFGSAALLREIPAERCRGVSRERKQQNSIDILDYLMTLPPSPVALPRSQVERRLARVARWRSSNVLT